MQPHVTGKQFKCFDFNVNKHENVNMVNISWYKTFKVYRRELAPGTVSLTGDRAQGDDSKHWAYSSTILFAGMCDNSKKMN